MVHVPVRVNGSPNTTPFNRFGREGFQESMKISNRVDPKEIDWAKFKFMVYDIPNHTGLYKTRYAVLGNLSYPSLSYLPFNHWQ